MNGNQTVTVDSTTIVKCSDVFILSILDVAAGGSWTS